jgi:hypothetical protein
MVSGIPFDGAGHGLTHTKGGQPVHGVLIGLAPDAVGTEQSAHCASPIIFHAKPQRHQETEKPLFKTLRLGGFA